jgi:beta-galactosidase GanA
LVAPTGRWLANRGAFAELARQLKEQGGYLRDHPPVEARVGVVVSSESAWAFAAEPPEAGFEYEQVWRDEFYLPIARQHYWRDVIDQSADFCPYHVLVVPLLPMVYRPTKERLREWVHEGGCLLLGPLTGHRSEEYTAWTDDEFGGLEQLMGATCSGSFRTAEEDEEVTVAWSAPPGAEDPPAEAGSPGGAPGEVPVSMPRGVCHGFTATTAHVLARYANGACAGQAAILMHKLGQGTVVTLGARVDAETYLDLIHTLCDLAKVEPLASGSADVAVMPRMNPDGSVNAYGLVNLTARPQAIKLPKAGSDRLSGREVGAEVTLGPRETMLVQVTPIVERVVAPVVEPAPAESSDTTLGDATAPAPAEVEAAQASTAVVAEGAVHPSPQE